MQSNNKQSKDFTRGMQQQQDGQTLEVRAHQAKLQDNPQVGTKFIETQAYRAQLQEKQPTGQPENICQEKEKLPSQEKIRPQEQKPKEQTVFQEKNISEENPCVEKEVKVIYKEKPVEEVCQPKVQQKEVICQPKVQQKEAVCPPKAQQKEVICQPKVQQKEVICQPKVQQKEVCKPKEKPKECQDVCQNQPQQPQGTILFTQMYQAKLNPQQGGSQNDQMSGMQLPGMGSQQSGMGSQQSGMGSQQSGMGSQQSGMGSQQSGMGSQQFSSMGSQQFPGMGMGMGIPGFGPMMSNFSASNTWTQPLSDAQGVVIGKQNYDREAAREDAMRLLKAMKGAGTDKDTIVEISGTRSFAQRQMIVKEYAQIDANEKRDLLQDLKSEAGGDLERLLLPLYMMPGEFDARLMEKAMYGLKNDVDLLNEVLCTRTNKELEDMKNAWNMRIDSKQRLEERVADETKKLVGLTNYHNLCLKLLEAKRPPCTQPNEQQVRTDAEELNHQLLDRTDLDSAKAKFVEIFTERSWAHIGAVVGEFQNISQKWTMDAAIGHEFGDSSNTTKALRVIAEFCFQPYDFWAKRIREAIKGLGTDDSALIRIIVSRSEVDMANIARVFGHRYGDGKTLKSWIESDTSGAYCQLLLNLCGYY